MTSVESNSESRRIEDYLRGRLNDEETRQFERRMLEDDELFAKVQREDLLRQGIADQPIEASEPKSTPWWRGSAVDRGPLIRWLQPALTGALAASVIVLVIGNLDLRQQVEQMQAPRPGIPVITLHDQRALLPGTEAQSNNLEDIEGPVLLEIDVSAYEDQEFTVEIQTARDTYIYERVQRDARGYLTVSLSTDFEKIMIFDHNQARLLKLVESKTE